MQKRRGEKVLAPVRANAGIEASYRQRLDALISEMSNSYTYWLRASYRANEPLIAQDATPAAELERELKKLGSRWEKKFDEAAPLLAKYFTLSTSKRTEARLKKILRDGGISVRFQMTPAMKDVLRATVAENVSLVKSIRSQYHTQVEGIVMRGVTAGRDLSTMTDELEKRFGITRRRAAFIARDQSQKATAVFTRVRQIDAGLTDALWLHSHAGKTPRPTHLANNGKRYSISLGWFDKDPKVNRYIFPGELINCRCVSKPIVNGFS